MTESNEPATIEERGKRKIVAIPTTWVLYDLPTDAFEIMGGVVQNPPLVVAEALVSSGMGRRVQRIETGIEIDSGFEEDSEDGETPWYKER